MITKLCVYHARCYDLFLVIQSSSVSVVFSYAGYVVFVLRVDFVIRQSRLKIASRYFGHLRVQVSNSGVVFKDGCALKAA